MIYSKLQELNQPIYPYKDSSPKFYEIDTRSPCFNDKCLFLSNLDTVIFI